MAHQLKMLILIYSLLTMGLVQAETDKNRAAFEAYKEFQKKQFHQYITDQEVAFKLYKNTYRDAFEDFKKNIETVWYKPEVTTKNKWVSYTNKFKQKTVIDFKKGMVTVSQVVSPKQKVSEVKEVTKKRLLSLNQLTYKKAYKEDPVSQKVDKVIAKKVAPSLVKTPLVSHRIVPVFATRPKPKDVIIVSKLTKIGKVVTATYKLNTKDFSHRVRAVLPDVMRRARIEKVPPALVLAIIENESAFNPLARSYVPAYGLMQVVPRSAGKDASKYLYGKEMLLSSAYLYTPSKNIMVGTAYLHILNYNYLRKIKHPDARLYCTIAAYNTGSGNVAKTFTGKYSVTRAAKVINQKSPEQVYAELETNLPYDETKHYLKKVFKSYQKYTKLVVNHAQ
ncbi:MAG: DUF3393 domain-containing protein [Methylococcales bacterium]|jgi:membrane-bound lytic murein transglycosylase C|nr:DUF3393 domain-containing protein [Methylococcales bacterium]